MIRDDVFVFDNVVHMYDYSDENLVSEQERIRPPLPREQSARQKADGAHRRLC